MDAGPNQAPTVSRAGLHDRLFKLQSSLNQVILGKPSVVELLVTTLLAGGHILLEDQPGVGKTTLASALAKLVQGTFSRIQFTADLLPSDIIGARIYRRQDERFDFIQGPIFANVVLADELNRAPPKTQSALLQAMNEGLVTIDRETLTLPAPFMVVATQNPRGSQGTYPLPESQRDRFLMRLSIGYPDPETEIRILDSRRLADPLAGLSPVLESRDVLAARELIREVKVGDKVLAYLARLVDATRRHEEISIPASPRASLSLMRSAQALAFLRGVEWVDIDLIKALAPSVLSHRLGLRSVDPWLIGEGASGTWVCRELLDRVAVE